MSAEELGQKLVGNAITPDAVDRLTTLGVRRFKLSARTWIGSVHQDILCDIKAFIYNRMKSSHVKDMVYLFTSIIGSDIRAFKALS